MINKVPGENLQRGLHRLLTAYGVIIAPHASQTLPFWLVDKRQK